MKFEKRLQKDRSRVLLALSAWKSEVKGACPSARNMAAFMDGKLEPGERQIILEHLDACPSCYDDWLAASSFTHQSVWSRLITGICETASVCADFANKRKICMISGLSLSAACLILIFLLSASSPEKLISESYQTLLVYDIQFRHGDLKDNLRLPWEKPGQSYGFAYSNRHTPPYRAFGAGLWEGRRLISKDRTELMPGFLSPGWQGSENAKKDKWPKTSWSSYYLMGKWCFLLKTLCLSDSDASPVLWNQQKLILKGLQKNFAKPAKGFEEDARIVNSRLDNIKSVLESSERDSPSARHRRKIASDADIIIKHLSPWHIPGQLPNISTGQKSFSVLGNLQDFENLEGLCAEKLIDTYLSKAAKRADQKGFHV